MNPALIDLSSAEDIRAAARTAYVQQNWNELAYLVGRLRTIAKSTATQDDGLMKELATWEQTIAGMQTRKETPEVYHPRIVA